MEKALIDDELISAIEHYNKKHPIQTMNFTTDTLTFRFDAPMTDTSALRIWGTDNGTTGTFGSPN